MKATEDAPDESTLSFTPTKREILLLIRREGTLDLETLADHLGISKSAAHRHVKDLENSGFVERKSKNVGVGRPRLTLQLAPGATAVFPRAYASITCAALHFIEKNLGREAVERALRERQNTTYLQYTKDVTSDDLGDRVRQLSKLRDAEGYMAEAHEAGHGYELLEYNCPVLAVAEQYEEACKVENEMFRKVLRADVSTSHRVVAGDHVCRFLITPRRRKV